MKKDMFFKKDFVLYDDVDIMAELSWKLDNDETKHVIKTADDVSELKFLFDMEHDMERTYEPVYFENEINWSFNPTSDPEFTWEFNRHGFLICLGEAYLITGKESYAQKAVEFMLDFIDKEPFCEEKRFTTWRILEIGIRGSNWIKALYMIKNSPALTEEKLQIIYESLLLHCDIIKKEHTAYCYAGNWGMLENHGLFLMGALLPDNGQGYTKHALHVIETGLLMQITDDGMQLEQSTMYHNEVLRIVMEIILTADMLSIEISDIIRKQAKLMAEASLLMIKPNCHIFAMGDSDDMDMALIMNLATVLFDDGRFKKLSGRDFTFEGLWMAGTDRRQKYLNIAEKTPEKSIYQMYDSGHTFIRSGWDSQSDVFHFDNGFLGTSHGHSDNLHVDMVVDGKDILVDSGRYCYENKPERFALKNTSGHNTITVDGKDFDLWENSWFSKTVSSQCKGKLSVKDRFSYVYGGHSGYMDLENPVWIQRGIISIMGEVFIICDECFTSGKHSYRQYFHFDSEGKLSETETGYLFVQGTNHNKTEVTVHPCTKNADINITDTEQSRHYNLKVPNKTLIIDTNGTGFSSMCTVFAKGNTNDTAVYMVPVLSHGTGQPVDKKQAEGLKITHKGKTYLIVISHTEMPGPVDAYIIEGCIGCGKIIIFEPEKSKLCGTVLSW